VYYILDNGEKFCTNEKNKCISPSIVVSIQKTWFLQVSIFLGLLDKCSQIKVS